MSQTIEEFQLNKKTRVRIILREPDIVPTKEKQERWNKIKKDKEQYRKEMLLRLRK